ncbi:hypothetical protein ACFWIA_02735 [Streptomyces sp. NPDC127068]|uniref:hypothetical protein n=1 Tax=Streptomyces sp. NPDC127068 TaxID=3347127 RepID=UPI00365E1714
MEVMTHPRCELEDDHRGLHAAAVRFLDMEPPKTVWAQWADGRDPESVVVLRDCARGNGAPPGADDRCTLYVDHPGTCSFDLLDPEHEHLMATNGAYRRMFERGRVSDPEDSPPN